MLRYPRLVLCCAFLIGSFFASLWAPKLPRRAEPLTREAALEVIANWTRDHNPTPVCAQALIDLNRMLFDEHPDLIDLTSFMPAFSTILDRTFLTAKPHTLEARATYSAFDDAGNLFRGDRAACGLPERARKQIVAGVAKELLHEKKRLASRGLEMCMFVPIDTTGMEIDPVTFVPFFPFRSLYATKTKSTVSGPAIDAVVSYAGP